MAKVVIPVGLDTKEATKNTKSVKDMLKTLNGTSKETGTQLEKAFSKGNAKTAKLITDLQKANAEIEKQSSAISDLKSRLAELHTGKAVVKSTEISSLTKELKDTETAAGKVAQQMDKVEAEAERIRQTSITINGTTAVSDPQKYAELTSELDRLGVEYQRLSDKANVTKSKLQEAVGSATQAEISKTNAKIQETSAKLDSAKASAFKYGNALKNSGKSGVSGLDKFTHRIGGLAKRVFIFSVITKALRALRNLFAQSAQGSNQFKGAVAGLQQNLWAIYSVLYQYVMPVVIKVMQLISRLAQNVLTMLSKIVGKSTTDLLKNGAALKKQTKGLKETGKAAKKASGQLAAFDEVNQVSKDTGDTGDVGDTGGVSFDAKPLSDEVKNVLDAILLVVGGALFVIGLLLVCTGVAIPTGIGLMIAGIAILAAQIASINWDEMPENIKTTLTYIAAIAGGFLLALGCILLGSPAHIGLAVGCIIAGVALIVAAVALNWDSIKEKIQGPLGVIMGIVGTALVVLGILALVGQNYGLGIALIIAGAGSIVTAVAANWDSIVNWVKKIWTKLKNWWKSNVAKIFTAEFWKDKFKHIKNGFKWALNGIIGFANSWIKGLNFLLTPIRGIVYGVAKAFKKDIKFSEIKIPTIPKLAKGGVIYQPTIAQIGEYSGARNNPEIVSPENKLREIYAEGNAETNALLQQLIQVMQKGMTVNVDGKQLMRINREAETRVGRQTVTGGFANAY